jgi:hypothetical protein
MRTLSVQESETYLWRRLFADDFTIDIVTGFDRVSDGTTTEFLSAVFSGSGRPLAIATVVASLW